MLVGKREVFAWRKKDESKPPLLLQYRSSKHFIIGTVCTAVFTVSLSNLSYFSKVEVFYSASQESRRLTHQTHIGHISLRHCKKAPTLCSSHWIAVLSYIPIQIVPVIPFALTNRVGVAENDGRKHYQDNINRADYWRKQYSIGCRSYSQSTARTCL